MLTATILSVIAVGLLLIVVPFGRKLGFTPLPWQLFAALAAFIVTYLFLVEAMKKVFYSEPMRVFGEPHRTRNRRHRIQQRAARFSQFGRTHKTGHATA